MNSKVRNCRNGRKMFDVRVRFRLDLTDIAGVMLYHVSACEPDDMDTAKRLVTKFTRTRALRELRRGFTHHGESFQFRMGDSFREYVGGRGDRDELAELADQHAAALFPELTQEPTT